MYSDTRFDLRRGDSPTATIVTIGDLTFVFSYSTIVAFAESGVGWFVSENVWSRTTGKHLTQETPVSKGDRMPHADFTRELDARLARLSVVPAVSS